MTASESEAGRNRKVGMVKQLTGGDPVRANFMRQNSFQFEPTSKVCPGNHRPIVNLDQAVKRRFIIVPFEVKPAQPDLEPTSGWRRNGPASCAGGSTVALTGRGRPSASTIHHRRHRGIFSIQDTLASWLEECCIVDRG